MYKEAFLVVVYLHCVVYCLYGINHIIEKKYNGDFTAFLIKTLIKASIAVIILNKILYPLLIVFLNN